MKPASVLISTYHSAFLHKGGGEYELIETAFNLCQLGLIADIYGPFSRDIEAYDIVLHFSLFPEALPFIAQVKSLGKRVVLWPNFWRTEALEQTETIARFFELCDAVVFKSLAEERLLRPLIPASRPILRVPAGVDPCFAASTPPRLFRDSYGLEDYLLWVGIIEPVKNQLAAILALRDLPLPVVFIGNARDAAYYESCRKAAPSHFRFLPSMPHKSDILRAALRECRLYIEFGEEPGGKSLLEAVISGARIAIPRSAWAEEHFGDFPAYLAAQDELTIAETVSSALARPSAASLAETVARRHLLPDALAPLCGYIRGEG